MDLAIARDVIVAPVILSITPPSLSTAIPNADLPPLNLFKKSSPSVSPYVQSMAEKIQEKTGTKVTIKESSTKKGFGKIEIEYYSHDDLDRIFHLLG